MPLFLISLATVQNYCYYTRSLVLDLDLALFVVLCEIISTWTGNSLGMCYFRFDEKYSVFTLIKSVKESWSQNSKTHIW